MYNTAGPNSVEAAVIQLQMDGGEWFVALLLCLQINVSQGLNRNANLLFKKKKGSDHIYVLSNDTVTVGNITNITML